MPSKRFLSLSSNVAWNLFLITAGVTLFSIGVKMVAQPHGFISGGIFGTGMLLFYATGKFSSSIWYFLLNIPLFILGWRMLSRRFILYSCYGFLATTLISQFITGDLGINDHMLAAVATGMLCGAGTGVVLRSLGSDGGLTIVAIILHNKYSLRVGQVTFAYNLVVFAFSLAIMDPDRLMYSIIIVFINGSIMDYFMSMFNHRKMALIITDKYSEVAKAIMERLRRGVTALSGKGVYTGRDKTVLLTVVHNYQLKRLEELVFTLDPNAFVIIESTFNVLGTGFSKRKQY